MRGGDLTAPLTTITREHVGVPASHGTTLGVRLTSNRLAQITLPLAVGAFAAPLGVLGTFWVHAALLLGAIDIMARSRAGDPGD